MKTLKVMSICLVITLSLLFIVGCGGQAGATAQTASSSANHTETASRSEGATSEEIQEVLDDWEDFVETDEIDQSEESQATPSYDTIVISEYIWGLPYKEAMEIVANAGYTSIPSFIMYDKDMMNGQSDRVEEIMQVYGFTDYNDLYGRVYGIQCRTGRQIINHTGEARDGNSIFYARPGQSDRYDLVIMVFGTSEQYWSQEP